MQQLGSAILYLRRQDQNYHLPPNMGGKTDRTISTPPLHATNISVLTVQKLHRARLKIAIH